MKQITSFFVAWVVTFMISAQTPNIRKYEVQPGETFYSIARKHGVTVASLLELNPGLQVDNIMAGQKINVSVTSQTAPVSAISAQSTAVRSQLGDIRPKYKTQHEVRKKETIYSLSRLYGITEDELIAANPFLKSGKLKKGAIIHIPYSAEEVRQYEEQKRQLEEEARKAKVQRYQALKVAVILPFSKAESTMTVESQKMVNLYQGFLLAVDSLKQHGCSVEIYVCDEAVDDVTFNRMLNAAYMKDVQLILGPVRANHLTAVAKFAHEHGIVQVVPLSNELSLVNGHPTLFQVNSPYSLFYLQVYNRFVVAHRQANIIFVKMNDSGDNMAYISGFEKALKDMSISYKTANVSDISTIRDALSSTNNNVIIPTSGSSAAFENLCKKIETLNVSEDVSIQFFGFPEWQTLSSKYEKNLAKYHCQFFTAFYSNSNALRTQRFNSLFRRWFNQDQYNSFPRYGELGYDIGVYFLKGLSDYGSAFYENIHNYSYFSLEFPFCFEKKNQWSGYQNCSIFFVTYKADGTVTVR